ncbi:hypothetical protein SNE40_020643 [Patella caerulea]|uniref:Uncharacterized protein n=1 Tax=Patella caerulea TaxID=87958 RepID=A0AAN8J4T3_PATCE
MLEDWSLEGVMVGELRVAEIIEVETITETGYEADDEGTYSDEEWMFGDEEWLVSGPFLADMADEMYSWLYEETFRPNDSSTPARPSNPPPASIFQPFTDIETLKSWYQPDSATPPPTPVKRKQAE